MNARKREGRTLLLATLLSVAGSAFLTGCGGDDDEKSAPPPPPPPAKSSTVMPVGN